MFHTTFDKFLDYANWRYRFHSDDLISDDEYLDASQSTPLTELHKRLCKEYYDYNSYYVCIMDVHYGCIIMDVTVIRFDLSFFLETSSSISN